VGGVGRYIHQLARSQADLGHDAHVLTTGTDEDRVAFEDGVWVHRIVPRPHPPEPIGSATIPAQIWAYAATMRDEINRIAARRPVHGAYAPIWDCEGAALLRTPPQDGAIPLVTGLQTMLRFWMETNVARLADRGFVADFVTPMLQLEAEMLRRSPVLHGISAAILHQVEAFYAVPLSDRATVVPLGLEDYRALPATPPPPPLPGIRRRILFVGRLESRKGIDTLFEAAQQVLPHFPDTQLDIVGNAAIPSPGGQTWRARFEADPRAAAIRDRVVFHGEVDDAALRGFYAACDIFAAPSRFESFGLIFVEAMMFAKPVIGCRAGGMPEVIGFPAGEAGMLSKHGEAGILSKHGEAGMLSDHEEAGLLAEPADAASLANCLTRLLADPALCGRLGKAGRRRYQRLFTPRRMAEGVVAAFEQAAQAAQPRAEPRAEPVASPAGPRAESPGAFPEPQRSAA
jgi:glycogen synthase